MILIGLTGSLATGKSTVSNLLRSEPYNLPIIDADILARQVVEPGTYGYRQVVKHFGPTTPDLLLDQEDDDDDDDGKGKEREDNETRTSSKEADSENHTRRTRHNRNRSIAKSGSRPLNRAALGRRIFGRSPSRVRDRKILNRIIHPLVRLAMLRHILYYHIRGHWALVLDIPLLYESALDVFCSVVIMVAVSDAEVQMRRLRERDWGLSQREAEERVGSQMGVGEKVGRTRVRGRERGKVLINDEGKGELEGEVRRVVGEVRREGGGWLWGMWLWGSPLGCLIVGIWEVVCSWRARRRWEVEHGKEKAES